MAKSAGDDPGYLRSIGSKTVVGQFRLVMVAILLLPVAALGIVPLVSGQGSSPVLLLLVPPLVAVAGFVLARTAARSASPPLPRQLTHGEAGATSVVVLRQATFISLALTEAPVVIGFVLSVVAGSVAPYLVGFVVGWPLMLVATLPTHAAIERIRTRLESGGVDSRLWDVLLSVPRRLA